MIAAKACYAFRNNCGSFAMFGRNPPRLITRQPVATDQAPVFAV